MKRRRLEKAFKKAALIAAGEKTAKLTWRERRAIQKEVEKAIQKVRMERKVKS
jgi:hypothetical protein